MSPSTTTPTTRRGSRRGAWKGRTLAEPMKRDGLVLGMSEDEYHGGGSAELSSTGAKLLLEAPARFKHVVIDGNRTEKKAWDVGTAVHTKVLGTGSPVVAYPATVLAADGSVRDKAKVWAAEQRAAGMVPVKQRELDQINTVAESLLTHPTAKALLEAAGNSEASVFASCPEIGVRLRGRFDRLPDDLDVALDVKTVGQSGGAAESEFTRQIFNFGYDVQAGQYLDTLKYATGRDLDFAFIVVELTAPYLVNVITMTHTYLEMGRVKSMEARKRYRHGLDTGEWPG
ncbi:hypothetical protein D3229_09755 [Leucobacter aridicollis]|nr:hypothetical protein [Leucobacter aridicollis]